MSVLECDRSGCENIMCGFYSHDYGYLCYDCLQELSRGGEQSIRDFMSSPKRHVSDNDAWNDYVTTIFKGR